MTFNIQDLAWKKMNGLIPAIVQHAITRNILMLGYMNAEALQITLTSKFVTFYSRSKNRLWTKGETSGNRLELVDLYPDCDKDALIISANPTGPVCHTGATTCFEKQKPDGLDFILTLENIIQQRKDGEYENSYTAKLFQAGLSRMAQKIGEEGVEVALAAIEKDDNEFCGEVADLLFHILVLLKAKGLNIFDVIKVLQARNK